MELANTHMAMLLNEIQERLFSEDKAISREKAVARIRAQMPESQPTIAQVVREASKKGKGDHAGED